MPSKRKLSLKAKRTAKKSGMLRPGGASKYALKRRRMASGWNNPRSPIQLVEVSQKGASDVA